MATYNIARDGHPYLTHGYPIVGDRGEEDVRFCTYQLNPRAEHLFEKARFEEGDVVSKETFYALLVEGSIYNDARPNGLEITSVPRIVLRRAEEAEHRLRLHSMRNQPGIDRAQYLVDVFDAVAREHGGTSEVLSASSWLSLLRRWRQHGGAHETRPAIS